MKTKIALALSVLSVLSIVVLLSIGITSNTHATETRKLHSVVVLRAQEQWVTTDQGNGQPPVTVPVGLGIYTFSSSAGAPTFYTTNQYQLPSLAQALADLLNDGYHIEHADQLTYTLVR